MLELLASYPVTTEREALQPFNFAKPVLSSKPGNFAHLISLVIPGVP